METSNTSDTREIWTKLFKAQTLDDYFDATSGDVLPPFCEYITKLCEQKGMTPAKTASDSDIDRSYGNRIFLGERYPSRDTVLKLSFGLGLNLEGTQQLLKVARMSRLHPKVKRDAVIAYCLHNGISLAETQLFLDDQKLPLLGGVKS